MTNTAWCTNSGTHTNYYYRASSYPHRFTPPSPVPASVTGAWVTATQATADITTAINGGVGHVLHRNHGGKESWIDPPYGISDINALTNAEKTPVVFSINCLTGSFARSVLAGDCFAEAFLKKSPGGCVGIVASSQTS